MFARMRWMSLGLGGLLSVGCAATGPSTPATSAAPAQPPAALNGARAGVGEPQATASTAATPPATKLPTTKVPATKVPTATERARAKEDFRQALEQYLQGNLPEAFSLMTHGFDVLGQSFAELDGKEALSSLKSRASFNDSKDRVLISDAETLLTFDLQKNSPLGLVAHDSERSPVLPLMSPTGAYVVAPQGDRMAVYLTLGLSKVTAIPVRRGAPFAFIDDSHIVTVRLGTPKPTPRALPAQPTNYVVRELQNLKRPGAARDTVPESATEDALPTEVSDDELFVVDLKTGRIERTITLASPPDTGLLRRVAALPPGEDCASAGDCEKYSFNLAPVGRRVASLRVQSGVLVTSWEGGSASIHRVRDGKLLGSFRPRGESWKPAAVAVVGSPLRAAVATSTREMGRGGEPPFSVTALVDLEKGRVVELIDECRWATAVSFSRDGKRLMVGDLRRACLHDGKTGRFIETTEELRAAAGPGDDLQDVEVLPTASGRWLLRTADGTFGVFNENGGKALLRGFAQGSRGALVAADESTVFLADYSGKGAELVSLGESSVARRVMRVEELEERELPPEAVNTEAFRIAQVLTHIAQDTCVIEGFRLPRALCERRRPKAQSQGASPPQ